MKTQYLSEILNKYFDTIPELEDAEAAYFKKQEAEETKKAALTARKKELAKAVEEAEQERCEAYSNYRAAEEEVKRILDESNAKMDVILKTAKDKIKAAEEKRFAAIANFNKEFGPYKAFYSDERARAEYNALLSRFFPLF